MGQLALNVTRSELQEISQPAEQAQVRHTSFQAPSRTVLKLGAILILLQIMDGVLTGIGINIFGTPAEGNAFLRMLMEEWGCVTALITVKTFAVGVVCALCMLSGSVRWVKQAMRIMICVYLVAAVLPWTAILLHGAL